MGIVQPMSIRPGALAQRIAAEIRAELGRQNHSRRWLALQIGENHVTVSRWVKGEGPMSFDSLDMICKALGISVADLLAAADTKSASGRDTDGNEPIALLVAAA